MKYIKILGKHLMLRRILNSSAAI